MDNHRDRYYKHVYMTKNDADIIEIISKTCRMSRKDVHDALIQFGLRWLLSNLETTINTLRKEAKTGRDRHRIYGEYQKYFSIMREWSKKNGFNVTPFL